MMLKRALFLLTTLCALSTGELLYARRPRAKNICGENRENCLNNSDCLCYCAVKGAPREKTADDKPIYIKDDPYGHYCYCAQRDLDIEIERQQKRESTKKSLRRTSSYK